MPVLVVAQVGPWHRMVAQGLGRQQLRERILPQETVVLRYVPEGQAVPWTTHCPPLISQSVLVVGQVPLVPSGFVQVAPARHPGLVQQ